MNILCIGNSFSQDASRYLHQIARADGILLNVYNLYIGGCTLERHYRNMLSGEKAYELDVNGTSTGFYVSLKDALLNRAWDYVSVQQASHDSVDFDTYEPYLTALCDYVRKCVPKAKLIVHQTWAYENGSERLKYDSHEAMFDCVHSAYEQAAKSVSPALVIRSGETMSALVKADVSPVYRDGFHASFGVGRYALGLTWYKALTGADVTNNSFADFDETIPPEVVEKIKACVMGIRA